MEKRGGHGPRRGGGGGVLYLSEELTFTRAETYNKVQGLDVGLVAVAGWEVAASTDNHLPRGRLQEETPCQCHKAVANTTRHMALNLHVYNVC